MPRCSLFGDYDAALEAEAAIFNKLIIDRVPRRPGYYHAREGRAC